MDLSKCGGICRGTCKHYEIGVECTSNVTYEPRVLKPLSLADVKEWMQITEGKGGIGRRDLMEWLIGEVERLTTVSNEPECQCCPECHCIEYVNKNLLGKGFRQCKKCGQEWWTDINYGKIDLHIKPLKTEVDRLTTALADVRDEMDKARSADTCALEGLRAALAEKEAECERLKKERDVAKADAELCRMGMDANYAAARQSGIIEGREEAAKVAYAILRNNSANVFVVADVCDAIRSIPITQEGK